MTENQAVEDALVPDADAQEQARQAALPEQVPLGAEVPDADALEQATTAMPVENGGELRMPLEANEADAAEQAYDVELGTEDDYR